MSFERSEQDAFALGALLRSEFASDASTSVGVIRSTERGSVSSGRQSTSDDDWLKAAQTELMARVGGASRPSTFPLFGESNAGAHRVPRKWHVVWMSGAAVAAGTLVALTWAFTRGEPALSFAVEDGRGGLAEAASSGRVVAPKDDSRTLTFSDGSRLNLASGGILRVRETDEYGADVVIERGDLSSVVTHRENTSWSVFAGPYEIQVIGTRFSTNWDPASQKLVVLLDEGSVRVVGADIPDHVGLKPGQKFEGSPSEAWKVTAQDAPLASAPIAGAQDSREIVEETIEASSDSTKAAKTGQLGARANWSALLADGKFSEIVDEANKIGNDECLTQCSIARLRALADAARYTGNLALAQQSLMSLRKRSPEEGPRAGYLLGSLSEARGQTANALAWYKGYLSEAPGGAFAGEALAGKMRALHALGARADASAAASEYIRQYPLGASAPTARRILDKR